MEDYPYKASTFILYPSFHEAGRATATLKKNGACDAIEVFDRAALHEAEKDEKMVNLVPGLTGCDKPCAGLLVECRGASQQILDERIAKAISTLNESGVHGDGADGPCPEFFISDSPSATNRKRPSLLGHAQRTHTKSRRPTHKKHPCSSRTSCKN